MTAGVAAEELFTFAALFSSPKECLLIAPPLPSMRLQECYDHECGVNAANAKIMPLSVKVTFPNNTKPLVGFSSLYQGDNVPSWTIMDRIA